MTKNTHILAGIVILLLGLGIGYLLGSEKGEGAHRMPDGSMMHGPMTGSMEGEMDAMMAGLSGKTGDAFDAAFLAEMIVHHEGAVAMAEAVKMNAKHPELHTMAEAIITAQTAEIAQMRAWLSAWYGE